MPQGHDVGLELDRAAEHCGYHFHWWAHPNFEGCGVLMGEGELDTEKR